jgi:hypothetical protein
MAPAGIRPAPGSPLGAVGAAGRLRWVDPGDLALAPGDRVAILQDGQEWLGEVVVPPERLVEWDDLEGLPVVSRPVPDTEWPSAPPTDGRRLLDSLGLPPELLERTRPPSAPRTVPPACD